MSQTVLRNCSKEAEGEASILYGFNDRGVYSQTHTMAEAKVRSA